MFSQSCGGRRVSPPISSVRAPTIVASNSPLVGEAGCPLKASVSVLRPQNDSGSPAQRPCTVARTSSPRATSGTTSWLACGRPPLSPVPDACASPTGDRSGPARCHSAPHSVPLPPARSAGTEGVEEKLCLKKRAVAVVGVVGTVNRRFKGLWENRVLVFPQSRQFPQRFRPRHLASLLARRQKKIPRDRRPGARSAPLNFSLRSLTDGHRSET